MKFAVLVDSFLADMRGEGRISSASSERAYRDALELHGEDASWRDPRQTTREDVKRTLRRWKNPNTARTRRSILISWYEWMVQEGLRKDNPARGTRPPKPREPQVHRLTTDETVALLKAARTRREKRVIFLGVCAGLRNAELRGLQGRHFRRLGWIWVSPDIGKGGRERWLPVISDLESVVADCLSVSDLDYVIPAQRPERPGPKRRMLDHPSLKASPQSLYRLVQKVGERAGMPWIGPHVMRRAFADHIESHAGVRVAQALLGHADISTTEDYLSAPTLDRLARSVRGLSFGLGGAASGGSLSRLRPVGDSDPCTRPRRSQWAFSAFSGGSVAIGRPCAV